MLANTIMKAQRLLTKSGIRADHFLDGVQRAKEAVAKGGRLAIGTVSSMLETLYELECTITTAGPGTRAACFIIKPPNGPSVDLFRVPKDALWKEVKR